ncbi:MAG: rhomboid family intramembrane serine protease [Verrucomicrobiota bacterium]
MGIHDRDYMRDDETGWKGATGPGGAPMIVWVFIAVSVVAYLISGPMGWVTQKVVEVDGQQIREISRAGSLSLADLAKGEIWRLFTHQFVHGSILHLLMNMLILFFLGKEVALRLGPIVFAAVYLIGGVAAALFELVFGFLFQQPSSMVGASGSVSALFGVFAMLVPNQVIGLLLFFVIPVRGRVIKLAWGWVILNLGLGLITFLVGAGGVAWLAHGGGTLYGFLHGKYFLGFKLGGKKSPRSKTVPYTKRGENPNIIDAKFTDKKPDYDEVLDKINREGISALTPEEREILERASEIIKGKNKT